jgi:hypothetical protein
MIVLNLSLKVLLSANFAKRVFIQGTKVAGRSIFSKRDVQKILDKYYDSIYD